MINWTPLTAFAVVAAIFGLGEFLSIKVKGKVSFLIFALIIFLIGFWAKLLPADITYQTQIPQMMGSVGIALLIVNMGTLIDIEEIKKEWKTVLIALSGFIGIALIAFTAGTWIFGREMALTAAPPISGGMVAYFLVLDAAMEAGRADLAAFALLVVGCQKLFGLPIVTYCLNHELARKLKEGDFNVLESTADAVILAVDRVGIENNSSKVQKPESKSLIHERYRTLFINFGLVGMVAALGSFLSELTVIPGSNPPMYYVHPVISWLFLSLIATKVGILPKKVMNASQAQGFILFAAMFLMPGSLAKISPTELLAMILPLVGLLLLSSIGISLVTSLVGRSFGYSPYMSIACGISCLIGYPVTEIISYECVGNMENATDQQKELATDYILPKMIISGFITVTISSAVFAAIITPLIFI